MPRCTRGAPDKARTSTSPSSPCQRLRQASSTRPPRDGQWPKPSLMESSASKRPLPEPISAGSQTPLLPPDDIGLSPCIGKVRGVDMPRVVSRDRRSPRCKALKVQLAWHLRNCPYISDYLFAASFFLSNTPGQQTFSQLLLCWPCQLKLQRLNHEDAHVQHQLGSAQMGPFFLCCLQPRCPLLWVRPNILYRCAGHEEIRARLWHNT